MLGSLFTGPGAIVIVSIAGVLKLRQAKNGRRSRKTATLSPFAAGSHCTELADAATTDRWLTEVVAPRVARRIEEFAVPLHEHSQARQAVTRLVDDVFSEAVTACRPTETVLSRQVWKWLWCDVVAQLVERRKIDEELDDVLRLCADPSFDPLAAAEGPGRKEPRRRPMAEASVGATSKPPNLHVLSSREDLARVRFLRLLEGTIAGAPIDAPVSGLVVLAFNPARPGHSRARADLAALAAAHPDLSFAQVSFLDTRRHFGKPAKLDEFSWVIAATGPNGRVFPEPIVERGSVPPSREQWMKAIAHARGATKKPRAWRIVRPKHFGDLVRWMMSQRRRSRGHEGPSRARPVRSGPRPRSRARRRGRRTGFRRRAG